MEMNKVGVSPQHSLNLFFYSTPSSPRFSSAYNRFEYHGNENENESESEPFSSVPFSWELTPGIPKSAKTETETEMETEPKEFEFSGQLDMMIVPALSSADQLFDAGKIRPLKPPPRLIPSPLGSPKSPHSNFKSPKQRSRANFQIEDPFEAALQNSANPPQVRGREANKTGMKRGSSRKGISRSLSPLRVSEFALLQQDEEEELNSASNNSRGGSKKWRLKDLFLFRSASEGTSRGKKYSFLSRRNSMENDDKEGSNKGSSFRSSASGGSGSVSKRRGGETKKISAHEMHYTSKRAVSEELKKKTSLAYRHSLLGCLGFNPILQHIPNAFSS